MGKCLSCYKASNAPGGCMNESSNSLKNKSEKQRIRSEKNCSLPSTVNETDSTIIHEQERNMPVATTGVNHNVNASPKLCSRKNSEEIVSDECAKSSPAVPKRHFPQLFSGKVANAEDKPTKLICPYETKLNLLFDKYKDAEDENFILVDGVERLCCDLNLRPDDFKVLILAWKFNADQMFQFSRQEFVNGCKLLDADNISQINSRLSECVAQLRNDFSQFKNLYKFTFKFGLDRAGGQRILPIDMAICLWKLVFTLNKPPILDRWLTFLQSDKTHIRGVPRDTWNMFLNFTETIGNDLSTYNDAEAWPSIFDDFVEYENDRLNQNVVSSDMEGQNSINEKSKTDNEVISAI